MPAVDSNIQRNEKLTRLLNAFPQWFLHFSSEEQSLSLALYRLLTNGVPVSKQALAEETEMPTTEIETTLNSWAGVYYNELNEIIGYWGLSIVEMPHTFIIKDKTLYSWCAWDALFIPELIRETACIKSQCPISNEHIELTVGTDGIKEVMPAPAVVSFIEPPSSEHIENDVIGSFCHYVHFFKSQKEYRQWASTQQGNFTSLTMEEAYELGKMKNHTQYEKIINV